MLIRTLTIAAAAALFARAAGAQQPRDFTPYLIADPTAEVALARSAAPAAVSDSATVLVLTLNGFVEASHGGNGFTCLVLRSFAARIGDPKFWNPKFRAPHCLTPPAVRTILPEMLKRTEWILAGVSPTDIPTYTAVTLLWIVVAASACLMPARRATAVDPAQSLRHE